MKRLWQLFWSIFPELLLAGVLVGQVVTWREIRSLAARVEALDPPADVVASEIEELRSRLAALERKAARDTRAKSKK